MTAPAPLTPSSPEWGTIVCDYCQRAPVGLPGLVCWNCASYVEYLENNPGCDCAHDPYYECRCNSDCTKDCPAPAPAWWGPEEDGQADGEEPVKGA